MKHIKSIRVEAPINASTNGFINALYTDTSKGLTENEAVTFIRSGSHLLDFYAQAGAMRKNKEKALDLFQKAFAEDRLKAVRILFYLQFP